MDFLESIKGNKSNYAETNADYDCFYQRNNKTGKYCKRIDFTRNSGRYKNAKWRHYAPRHSVVCRYWTNGPGNSQKIKKKFENFLTPGNHTFQYQKSAWGENPYNFDPNRFLDGRAGKLHPYQNIPFSAGRRSCIGRHFAMQELKERFFSKKVFQF